MSAPVPKARSAYLISNAQVTGARRRTTRRRVGSHLAVTKRLIVEGQAFVSKPGVVTRPLSGDCERPIGFTEVAGRSARLHVDTDVRCRKCGSCLRWKRRVWSARAAYEIGATPRTWMVSLTATPTEHYKMLCRTYDHPGVVAPSRHTTGEEALWKARADEFGKLVTLWLKRVRARGARLSYLLVTEAHKSGLPHVHLLVHDLGGTSYRRLTETWPHGFAHAKLVEGPDAARYVTKYLVKSMLARVRASQHYGHQTNLPMQVGPTGT